MTVEDALVLLIEMDQQFVCPRPTPFGEMAHLLYELALHVDMGVFPDELMGDLAGLADRGHWPLPKDAEKTWRLPR